ncbi:uncharacterized protein LOC122570481 [Bombus pyrosoma]|uniref:uncharacterized protein LOC122570481 n=1 Tax=Bombus pyrosoma TaxID=396416 RepID=UPI001CB950FB|nr:uncharacterized protein LOC122570481 [Bombus pyrosoma]
MVLEFWTEHAFTLVKAVGIPLRAVAGRETGPYKDNEVIDAPNNTIRSNEIKSTSLYYECINLCIDYSCSPIENRRMSAVSQYSRMPRSRVASNWIVLRKFTDFRSSCSNRSQFLASTKWSRLLTQSAYVSYPLRGTTHCLLHV